MFGAAARLCVAGLMLDQFSRTFLEVSRSTAGGSGGIEGAGTGACSLGVPLGVDTLLSLAAFGGMRLKGAKAEDVCISS